MNRRNLLKALATSVALPMGLSPLQSVLAAGGTASQSTNGRRIVLIELSGANDGLNTLVPLENDHYHRLRPTLGLGRSDVIGLNDSVAMHNALKPLVDIYERGELAWVQGLGYPQPNRSHFASIALWESGGDGYQAGKHGWMTHDIEHKLGRTVNDAHGISLKGGLNLFNSVGGRWMSFESSSQIEANTVALPSGGEQYNAALDKVVGKMHELHHTMNSLSKKLDSAPAVKNIPGGQLGNQLAQVRRLIQAGVDTPVYRVQLGGFDTHENQRGRHQRLLTQLSRSTAAFRKALIQDKEWDNTIVMTYSEFGRRAAENLSGGTDHGTAAPHWIMGGQINGGLYGESPDLGQLVNGDPHFTTDYRSLYQQVLTDWFEIKNNQFGDFESPQLHGIMI